MVVGGGKVAERKVFSLLKAGASVTVNSPDLTSDLQNLAEQKKIDVVSSEFEECLLDECFLVIGATNNEEINRRIADESALRDILYNIVDVPDRCNFYVPSLLERGDLSIAISTNGKSPALAKRLRKRLEKEFGEEYAGFLKMMGEIREKVVKSPLKEAERTKLFESLLDSDLLEMFCENKEEDARNKADDMVDAWIQGRGDQ